MSWDSVRTPDDRFAALPDYPFPPRFLDVDGLRVHYVDEGRGRPIVLFHGEPTWSFLYRKIIAALSGAYRVISPDYPGFGKSDKPTDPEFYTYDRHVEFMAALLEHLGIAHATAVVQDWGGPIGLRLAIEHPAWFDRLVIMNTGIFSGRPPGPGFMAWREFVERTDDLPIGLIMARSQVSGWPADVLAGYEAPFPDRRYKVGAHRFPLIVPISPDQAGAEAMGRVRDGLAEWSNPCQVLFSTADPIFSLRVGERFVERIPGASVLETIEDAGHFLQEDQGELVAARILAFLGTSD